MITTGRERRGRRQPLIQNVIHIAVVLAMLLAMAPAPALASGAAAPSFGPAANCELSAGGPGLKVFMPMVADMRSLFAAARPLWTAKAPAAAPRALNYQIGKTYTYEWRLTIDTKSSARDSQGAMEEGSGKTVFYALADIAITGQEAGGAFSGRLILRRPYICNSQNNGESVVDDAELFAALAMPMTFTQKPNGEITGVSFPQNAPNLATNIQKGILNALQAILRADENSYTITENGGQGTYNANYVLAEQGDDLQVTKTFSQDSFLSLISAGTDNDRLQLQTTVKLLLSADRGAFSSVEVNEYYLSSDESEDPESTDGGGIDGVAAWSEVETHGGLQLIQVSDTPAAQAAALPDATYVDGNLGAILPEAIQNEAGVNLADVDIDAELGLLEAEPDNPARLRRVLNLMQADDQGVVLDKVRQRLEANVGNTAIVAAYIDLLGQNGSDAAQLLLNQVLGAAGTSAQQALRVQFDQTAQQQALINISTLGAPNDATLQVLEGLTDNADSPLQDVALTVLGAAADHVRDEQPERADQIVASLNARLAAAGGPGVVVGAQPNGAAAAQDNETLTVLLDAVGNAGDVSSLGAIDDYVASTDVDLRVAALTALRKIPGDAAEGLLVSALTDDDEDDALRNLVAALMDDRALSDQASAALEAYREQAATAAPGLYQIEWNRHLGGGNAGVNLPGRLVVSSPPRTSSLYMYADQKAVAHLWSYQYQLIRGQLLSQQQSNGRLFGAYLTIGNNLIFRKYEQLLACTTNLSGTLYQGSLTVFNFNQYIPVYWVVAVVLNVRASGYFQLTWGYSHNLCTLNNSSMIGRVTPLVYVSASASAWVDVTVARGGATLEAQLLRSSIPTVLSASYNGAALRFCIDSRVTTQALVARLFAWADVRVPAFAWPPWKWSRVLERHLWSYSTPAATYTLLVRCY